MGQQKRFPSTTGTFNGNGSNGGSVASPAGFVFANPGNITAVDGSPSSAPFTLQTGDITTDNVYFRTLKLQVPANATITQLKLICRARYQLTLGAIAGAVTAIVTICSNPGVGSPAAGAAKQTGNLTTSFVDQTITFNQSEIESVFGSQAVAIATINNDLMGGFASGSVIGAVAGTGTFDIDAVYVSAITYSVPNDIPIAAPDVMIAQSDAHYAASDSAANNLILDQSGAGNDLPVSTYIAATAHTSAATQNHSGTATYTLNSHQCQIGSLVLVAGYTQPEYNGYKTVLTATSNTFTTAISGDPTTPATGSGTITRFQYPATVVAADTQAGLRLAFTHNPDIDATGTPNYGGPQAETTETSFQISSLAAALQNTDFTAVFIVRPRTVHVTDASGNQKAMTILHGTGTPRHRCTLSDGYWNWIDPTAGTTKNKSSSPPTPMIFGGPQMLIVVGKSDLSLTMRTSDGQSSSYGGRNTAGNSTGIRIGTQASQPDFSNFFSGDVMCVMLQNSAMSVADQNLLFQWANRRHGVPLTLPRLLICDGDSITAGVGSSQHNNYPNQLLPLVRGRYLPCDTGISGAGITSSVTSALRIDDATHHRTVIDDYAALLTPADYMMLIGINDIRAGATASSVATGINSQAAWALSVGFRRIFVGTLLDQSLNRSTVLALNNLIVGNARANNYTAIPLHLDPLLGISGANANATYFRSDLLHLTNAGYARLASLIAPYLTAATATSLRLPRLSRMTRLSRM